MKRKKPKITKLWLWYIKKRQSSQISIDFSDFYSDVLNMNVQNKAHIYIFIVLTASC